MVYIRYWIRTGMFSGHWEIEAIEKSPEEVQELIKDGAYTHNGELIGSEARIIDYDDMIKLYNAKEAMNILNQYKDRYERHKYLPDNEPIILKINLNEIEAKIMEHSKDPHMALAKLLFDTENPTNEQRRLAKTINYGKMYGN